MRLRRIGWFCGALLLVSGCATPTLSSGLFSLPANAVSVDWAVVNDSPSPQTVRVTVYKLGTGPKTAVPPGSLTVTVSPNEATHNANSVGAAKPFVLGFYYEVVVEASDRNVLPTVHIWQDLGNTVIPGTRIGPTDFKRIH